MNPRWDDLAGRLAADPAVATLATRRGSGVAVPEAARALFLAALRKASPAAPTVVGVATASDAQRLANDLEVIAGAGSVAEFPAWETLPFERVSPDIETMGARLEILWRLRSPVGVPDFVVAPVKALIQRITPPEAAVAPVCVARGASFDTAKLVGELVSLGYRREYQVEHRGELAVRGGIVDVFPPTGAAPLRMDFFGDELERLSAFDVTDQRSTIELDAAVMHGCREVVCTEQMRARARALVAEQPWGRERWEKLAEGDFFDGMESWLPWIAPEMSLLCDVLDKDARLVLVDAVRMRRRAEDLVSEEQDLADTLAGTWGAALETGEGFPRLHADFDRLGERCEAPVAMVASIPDSPGVPAVEVRGWGDLIPGDVPGIAARLGSLARDGYTVVVCARTRSSATRMSESLSGEGVDVARLFETGAPRYSAGVSVDIAPLDSGVILPSCAVALLTESDVTGRHRAHRSVQTPRARARAARPVPGAEGFFADLSPGDYVVHRHHGVGRYAGMVRRALGGAERDYLLIEYRGDDKLYVPSDQLDQLTAYGGGETPALHRLGGSDFQRTRAKVRAAVERIAQELVVLYSARMASPGHVFPPDTPWQQELEDAFPFEETPDQLRAIAEVKSDMEASHPMDRIVCGDVGFGKTEIAVRAAFKAVQDGKQVAVLVPTTLLAQQHHETFSERMSGFPVRVEMLSRFLTPAQAAKVTEGLADGSVDLVIGTHRLLSGDVKIKDLGLLVVDEEQRFGVTHKEAIKAISTGVDVLTLTATPIPRTLEMGLTGIRDITVLSTPPAHRQPILTFVGEYDERAAVEAIRRELLREGQAFYVHNRVRDIRQCAAHLSELVPEARIAVAHGQMDEASLESVVIDFADGRYDVLCCTTIIESGIDMPTVNTLVVDRADRLGLGQMHQLRGRVGRAGQRAYAYLFYPPDARITEEAFERLRTIGEHTELGSGLKIALRDLEIRGAGNLLGSDQSGHIAAVGYDLYVAMVGEALAALKGEPPPRRTEISIEVPLDAYLPPEYVSRDDARVEAYRALATVETEDTVEDIAAEWRDRYGPLPAPAAALLDVGRLRAQCVRCGVTEITVTPARPGGPFSGRAVARVSPLALRASAQVRLARLHPDAVAKEVEGGAPTLVVPLPRGTTNPASFLVDLLGQLVEG